MKTIYSGTKTEENLKKALAGESEARNKYTFYASKAKKDGYEQIAAIFAETALKRQYMRIPTAKIIWLLLITQEKNIAIKDKNPYKALSFSNDWTISLTANTDNASAEMLP